jgi:hypothetical protein
MHTTPRPWHALFFDPRTPELVAYVIAEVCAALPQATRWWPAGVPTVRQQRARARALLRTRAEFNTSPPVNEAVAWWEPGWQIPRTPREGSLADQLAFIDARMRVHLVRVKPRIAAVPELETAHSHVDHDKQTPRKARRQQATASKPAKKKRKTPRTAAQRKSRGRSGKRRDRR